jgi:hypothetical protein
MVLGAPGTLRVWSKTLSRTEDPRHRLSGAREGVYTEPLGRH